MASVPKTVLKLFPYLNNYNHYCFLPGLCTTQWFLALGTFFYLHSCATNAGGDFDTLIKSIRTKLFVLPDETVVYSGHGEPTTIGEEKKYNPFLK